MTASAPIAIIGGGLSGLAAGIHLARQGMHVHLFEAQTTFGGCCSTTRIDGYTFNNGAMYIAVPRLLDHAFARLGLDRATQLPLRRIAAPQASFLPDGTAVHFAETRSVRIDGDNGQARTATLEREIERCLAKWSPLLRIFTDELLTQPLSLPRAIAKSWRHLHKLRGTLAAELQRMFSDPDARAAFSAVTLYTGLPPEKTPAMQMVGLLSLLEDGLSLPEDGMGAISRLLEKTLRDLGGKLHADACIERIRVEKGVVRALVFADGTELPASAIISTASGMATFGQLLHDEDVPAPMRRRVANAPLSHRTLAVQLGLANRIQAPAHSVNHVPLMLEQYRMLAPQPDGVRWFNYTVPTMTLPELAPAGGSVIEMFASIDQGLPPEAWNAESERIAADSIIAALARHHRLDIAVQRITSPRDYQQRMRLYDGAVYGLSPAAAPGQQFPHRTPIEGLYLAGQTTYPGFGVATAMFSGLFAADALIRDRR